MRQLLNMKRTVAIFWPNTAHGKAKGQLSHVQQTGLPTISKEQPVTHKIWKIQVTAPITEK